MIEPQALSFIDSIWFFLWVLTEPYWAIVPLLNPYVVLIAAMVLGVIPFARRAVTSKAILAAIIAYGAYLLSPLPFDLPPLPPEVGMNETYALLSVLVAEAWLVIAAMRRLRSGFKALANGDRVAFSRRYRASPLIEEANLSPDFNLSRMQPIALGASHTLSVRPPESL
jgi:hypothetical protein